MEVKNAFDHHATRFAVLTTPCLSLLGAECRCEAKHGLSVFYGLIRGDGSSFPHMFAALWMERHILSIYCKGAACAIISIVSPSPAPAFT